MGSLKTMELIKYLVLMVLLVNCNRLTDATTSSSPLQTTTTSDGLVINNSTIVSLNNSASNERSKKISSDRSKESAKNATILPIRRNTNGRPRDKKLMSLLHARQRTTRWRPSEDCDRQCKNSNDDYCKLKCNRDMKIMKNSNVNNTQSDAESTKLSDQNKSHTNSISQPHDEFLDTEESVHGLYFADPMKINSNVTKESSNLIRNNNNSKTNSQEQKTRSKMTNDDESTTKLPLNISTKASRRKQYSRTSTLPGYRSTVYRGRIKYSPSNSRTLEESDIDPLILIGQKLSSSSPAPDIRKLLSQRRTPSLQLTTPSRQSSRSKEEELEIMEVSVAKQSSTETNRVWKIRNFVALNNFMRRLKPIVSSTIVTTKQPESFETSTKTTIRYETIHTRKKINQNATTISAINELIDAEGVDDVKNVFMRSTSNYSIPSTESYEKDLQIKTIYRPSGMPSLIINVPDDATPVFYNDPRNYEQSDGELESSPTDTTETIELTDDLVTTSIPSSSTVGDDNKWKYLTSLPNINYIFENISTIRPTTDTQRPSSIQTLRPSSTESILIKTTISSATEMFLPPKTTRRVYTTIPRKKPNTTVVADQHNRTTISTFLSNASSRRMINNQNNETTQPSTISLASTVSYQTTTTILPTEETPVPALVDFEIVGLPSSVTPETVTTSSSRPDILFHGISTTNKPQNTEVLVEIHEANTATYVLAGLGLLPLIVIVLYVVRHYIYRHEHKDDLENYGNDIQPISPVVTLDQSDDGEDSMNIESDFNRNNLRFKSLLGEGNFGQVWKAEADNLIGHMGATRIVAVKTERVDNGQGGLKAECEIMRKLGVHSNVVTLLGACVEQEPHLLIMEYAMRGRLLSLLRAARGVLNGLHHPPSRQPVMPLSPRRLTGFAHDIARGMEYIAEKRICHRDLAARNVLLDHNGICKICDFGMSIDLEKMKASHGQMKIPRVPTYQNKFKFDMTARVFGGLKHYASSKSKSNNCDTKNRPALPIRWMAPEALQYHIYSVETDVFAFGIVLWELASLGITPYPTLSGREVLRGVPNGVRPDIPQNCRQELSEAMLHCWHKDPTQRPSFTEVRKSLARALVQWKEEATTNHSEYLDVSGFSEDYENGMIYFNRRVSEFECEI